MNSIHLLWTLRNLRNKFSIILFSSPEACMDAIKSVFLILRFFPLSVNASSSVSSGMTNAGRYSKLEARTSGPDRRFSSFFSNVQQPFFGNQSVEKLKKGNSTLF